MLGRKSSLYAIYFEELRSYSTFGADMLLSVRYSLMLDIFSALFFVCNSNSNLNRIAQRSSKIRSHVLVYVYFVEGENFII